MRNLVNTDPRDHDQRDGRAALLMSRLATGRDDAVRRKLLALIEEVLRDPRRGPETVTAGLRAARELGSAERRFVSDAVHDVIRMRLRLEAIAGARGAISTAALVHAWIAWRADPRAGEERIATLADPVERLSLSASMPGLLARRFVDEYGAEEAARLCDALNRRAPLTVRANRVKCTREELAARLAEIGVASHPTPLAADGLTLETRRNVYSMAPFSDGWMELQDEGSQLIAELVAPPPRGSVVDACAGAGGKTLALGAALKNRGRLLAIDVSDGKLDELRKRARRAGLTNVQAMRAEEGPPDAALGLAADRVLLDVPCSGIGALRRNPEARYRLSERDFDELRALQRRILEEYAPLVAPGGRLIYATCSLFAEENAAQVAAFLADHPAFEPVPAKEILGKERALAIGDGEALRLLPHVHGTDGFYARVLRRRA
jgi:16S rRNA (cytosine967-C5)-methyltransferase